jgi:glycosyltransferase involved in cell wall biosynthesis
MMAASDAPPRRRVIFVNRRYRPDEAATSQLLTDLAEHLAARGFAVEVIAARFRPEDGPSGERIAGVAVRRLGAGGTAARAGLVARAFASLGFALAAAFTLVRGLRPGDAVVAMTDPPLLGVMLAPAVALRRGRMINWLQDVFPETAAALGIGAAGGWLGRALAAFRNRALRRAAANVVIGRRMEERLSRAVPDGRWALIPNWALEEPDAPPPPAASGFRRSLGLTGQFVVGYSGNLGRAHEFGTLLGAAIRLRDRRDIVFLIVGSGFHRARLEADVAAAGLTSFLFAPPQPRAGLADSLAAADAHLVSLRPALEGLVVPSKLYGVAAAARPVLFVGDPAGEIGALCAANGCGMAIAEGDEAGLADAILALADDPDERQRLGRAALALIQGPLSRKLALERWERLLGGG